LNPNQGAAAAEPCALCPRLCRHVCPVASAGLEAATPTAIAGAIVDAGRGLLSSDLLAQALDLCVNCGGCAAFCHIQRPLPALIRAARASPGPLAAPLGPAGSDPWVAVTSDARPWGDALGRRLRATVEVVPALPEHGLDGPGADAWCAAVSAAFAPALGRGARLVLADGGSARVLRAAGVPFTWLHEILEVPVEAGCSCDPSRAARCCGALGPLAGARPDVAARMGRRALRHPQGRTWGDVACASHLRRLGADVDDIIDRLIAEEGA
jgi:hypothetical protein